MAPETPLRRCAAVAFLPKETLELDLPSLLTGGDPVQRSQQLLALAAHCDEALPVDAAEVAALARLSPERPIPRRELVEIDDARLARLVEAGLVIRTDAGPVPDAAVRDTHWEPLAAVTQRHARWNGVIAPDVRPGSNSRELSSIVLRNGSPPEASPQRGDAKRRCGLPMALETDTARLLRRRATCRNFDLNRPLPLALAATVLQGVFGAQASVTVPAGAEVLKKLSPSGGGLHPTEAYVLAVNVEGLEAGVYHYNSRAHALDPLFASPRDELRAFALKAVAGQHWFADAPLLVVHACRFGRSFWKYRKHLKAWRAVVMDIGHLSMTTLTMATELGLGAFITVAINEVEIEQALGLDPLTEGPLAVAGFGWRAAAASEYEFDPLGAVWQASKANEAGAEEG